MTFIWMKETTMMHSPRISAMAADIPATCFLTEFSYTYISSTALASWLAKPVMMEGWP